MGVKAVREHYGIGHIVHARDGKVLVGSPYVNDLLSCSPDGRVTPNRVMDRDTGEIARIRDAMRADPATLAALIAADDRIGDTVPVWTWDDEGLVERRCEAYGWPNVTTEGELMYENRFFEDRDAARAAARREAAARVEWAEDHLELCRADLAKAEAALASARLAEGALDAG